VSIGTTTPLFTPALQQGIFLGMSITSGDKPIEDVRILMTPHPASGKTPP
jgi:hypothetical protein